MTVRFIQFSFAFHKDMMLLRKLNSLQKLVRNNLIHTKESYQNWANSSHRIKYWPYYWYVSNLLLVDLCKTNALGQKLLERLNLCVVYQNNMKLIISSDKWKDLLEMVETYKHYSGNWPIQPPKGAVVLDVGAHLGTFSVPLLNEYPQTRVYAFEPNPDNYEILKKNKQINGISDENLILENCAIYKEEGQASFTVGSTSTVGALSDVGFFKSKSHARTITCRTRSLVDFFAEQGIEHCYLLKMDCEGSEYDIFESLPEEMFERIENLIIEVHPTKSRQPSDLKTLLESKGYQFKVLEYDNGCLEIFGAKRG